MRIVLTGADGSIGKNLQLRLFRLPNVFGKWYKPNYNSAVATFCPSMATRVGCFW